MYMIHTTVGRCCDMNDLEETSLAHAQEQYKFVLEVHWKLVAKSLPKVRPMGTKHQKRDDEL